MILIVLTLLVHLQNDNQQDIFWPVELHKESEIQLTGIGGFAVQRSPRPGLAAHLHTGVDIKRPDQNFKNAYIYPIASGKVISKRDDGPYAQLIIAHNIKNLKFWTLYEHIAGIMVQVDDSLQPGIPVARFMNMEELNRYGWQFNHFHFEILKTAPVALKAQPATPQRFFRSRTLTIYNRAELNRHYFDPIAFFATYIH